MNLNKEYTEWLNKISNINQLKPGMNNIYYRYDDLLRGPFTITAIESGKEISFLSLFDIIKVEGDQWLFSDRQPFETDRFFIDLPRL